MNRCLLLAGLLVPVSCAIAATAAVKAPETTPKAGTDWGGGYVTGVDSATLMSSTSATGATAA